MKKHLRTLTLGFVIVVILAMLSGCDSIMDAFGGVKDNNLACEHEGGIVTCTEKAVCTLCGETYGEAPSHNIVVDEAVAPTCTTTGLTVGKHCSVCNKVLLAQDITPALGHDEIFVEAAAPTCTKVGYTEGKKCLNCDATDVIYIPALGHNYYKQDTIMPTETTEGYTAYYCLCGYIHKDDIVRPLASVGLEYEVINHPIVGPICMITGIGTCTDLDIIIPSAIENTPVKIIGESAFEGNHNIKSVTMTSVNVISDSAFYDCVNLEKVNMEAVVEIAYAAFGRCFALKNVVLPKTLTKIGVYAFTVCSSLESIVIPYGVSKIGDNAFAYNYNLTIYCEIDSKPFGWAVAWNAATSQTIWNFVKEGDDRIIHSFGEWYVEKEATETTGKIMRRNCLICDHYEIYAFEKIKVYYGVSTNPNLTDATGLSYKYIEQKTEKTTVYADNGEYIYYYSPVSQGECIFCINGFIGGFRYLGSYYIDGIEYYVYRSSQHSLADLTFYVN